MKRVFGLFEVIFDLCYLAVALIMGINFVILGKHSNIFLVAGVMAFVLVGGDAFHLFPRIIVILTKKEEAFRAFLGRGKQITSITMTVFYLLLWELGQELVPTRANTAVSSIIYGLAIIRILLCFMPQNKWVDRFPPVSWGIIRNIPFFLIGIIVSIFYYWIGSEMVKVRFMWIAILLSFAFYLPVVLFANKNPKIGMLMLPKTCMYLWILATFFTFT